jgi:hypothetical protein
MNRHRVAVLLLAAAGAVAVACTDVASPNAVPIGFVTITARGAGAAYTASPVGTFYRASGLGIPTASAPWDSCRQQSYSSRVLGLGEVYPSLGAGSAIQVALAGRVDSLFPIAVGSEQQYRLRGAALAYTPGESASVVIPGADDGFPAVTFKAKTAEQLSIAEFTTPPSGTRLDLRWNAGHDLNGTVAVSFRYGALGADTLNTQVLCQFKDDGADSIPARYMAAWSQAVARSWAASRVRTLVLPVARGGYFDFISTFDYPTPTSR